MYAARVIPESTALSLCCRILFMIGNLDRSYAMLHDLSKISGWICSSSGYRRARPHGKVARLWHVLIAENALGKPLPPKAEVHHVNGDKLDNRPENLVICPNRTYHKMLHYRMRAYEACGHADYRKCFVCGKYDHPDNLDVTRQTFHNKCLNERKRLKRNRTRSEANIGRKRNPNGTYCKQ